MTKKEIRKTYTERRRLLDHHEKDRMEDLMLIRFQQLKLQVPGVVMSYLPMQQENEYNPVLVTRYLSFLNPSLTLAFPVLTDDGERMFAVKEYGADFERNSFGILEPVTGLVTDPLEIDMVIVPLLAFNKKGYRVGYGKGYYDSFLADCRSNALLVGFSFFDPVDNISDLADHDIPLDYCVLPKSDYYFNN